ncbi:uncharacterized protein LOC142234385 [Haematobia irritans]|uniref:uncharacterized protein LOC142234385 n=1 Tax=Haematobia irritans TaxID=7368 RepID=UPI003F502527
MSDNGRNFLGTSRTLSREFARFHKCISNDISQKYVSHGFEWCFIPPHAPHMGGLWEAAVKSFKFHFRRIAGAHKFTFEQMATLLARIEGLLNSRPISALSEDPSDINALTPGHFLKGAPLVSLPEPISQNLSLINRWEKLKAMHHQFSLRWKEDYLKSLQKRYKWKTTTPNIKNDDLVVVMDDLLPPNEWRLGRVQKTFMGSDNNVRVAEIRLSTGTITRPIVKLCVLPYHNDEITCGICNNNCCSPFLVRHHHLDNYSYLVIIGHHIFHSPSSRERSLHHQSLKTGHYQRMRFTRTSKLESFC